MHVGGTQVVETGVGQGLVRVVRELLPSLVVEDQGAEELEQRHVVGFLSGRVRAAGWAALDRTLGRGG